MRRRHCSTEATKKWCTICSRRERWQRANSLTSRSICTRIVWSMSCWIRLLCWFPSSRAKTNWSTISGWSTCLHGPSMLSWSINLLSSTSSIINSWSMPSLWSTLSKLLMETQMVWKLYLWFLTWLSNITELSLLSDSLSICTTNSWRPWLPTVTRTNRTSIRWIANRTTCCWGWTNEYSTKPNGFRILFTQHRWVSINKQFRTS